jgi:hypothetical protein
MSGQPNQPWAVSLSLVNELGNKPVVSCGGGPRVVCKQTLVSDRVVSRAEVGARGVVARSGEWFIAIDDFPSLEEIESGSIKACQNGQWTTLMGVRYYRASIKFTLFRAISESVDIEVTRVAGNLITETKYIGAIENEFQGSLEVILVPKYHTSYGKVTIGAATSGEEAGDGVANGNWHAPNPQNKMGHKVSIDRKVIEGAPHNALWSFNWNSK